LTFDVLGTKYGRLHYEIITRSTFGIYQFLGRILREQASERIKLLGRVGRAGPPEDLRILAISTSGGVDGCFVDIAFEGENYCVPRNGAEQTKQIFSLLVQLLALKTQTGDSPSLLPSG
jgi:hypothetical protein